MKWILRFAGLVAVLAFVLVVTVYIFFGRGEPYADLSGPPRLAEGTIEPVVISPRPMGNAAISASGRIFYTIHPESNPDYPKLYEWVNGKSVAYPPEADQPKLFQTPLGVKIDAKNRLWIIDPGKHGFGQPKLIAMDLATNKVVDEFNFPSAVAPMGSFLQDLQISTDGRWVYIADVGFWAKRPAIVVYDSQTKTARRVLNRDVSTYPQNILIRNQIKSMSFFGGLLEMKTGVDGIALSRDNQWVYYAAMNHDTLYRVPTSALQDTKLEDAAIAKKVEAVGKKPLNDGLSIDDQNNVFITDIEHQAVLEMSPEGKLSTVVKDKRIRWADGLTFGPDGWLYLADSAIPELVWQNAEHDTQAGPYYIWRFKPGTSGAAGQ